MMRSAQCRSLAPRNELRLSSFARQWSTGPAGAGAQVDPAGHLECVNSHVPPQLMALLKGKDVMLGVIDVASETVETPEQVADTIGMALQFVPRQHLTACTNCGLAPMKRELALGLRDPPAL